MRTRLTHDLSLPRHLSPALSTDTTNDTSSTPPNAYRRRSSDRHRLVRDSAPSIFVRAEHKHQRNLTALPGNEDTMPDGEGLRLHGQRRLCEGRRQADAHPKMRARAVSVCPPITSLLRLLHDRRWSSMTLISLTSGLTGKGIACQNGGVFAERRRQDDMPTGRRAPQDAGAHSGGTS
ncbi:hypothetical protein Hypma_005421 [Hypsizygus marmoreus]|uniref:Uncharacterized protein n=1 Tax=Hypsizygus marmoreus TaxID=39966 RepID=A0A369J1S0_HYPMA|nr:hypothetical protein Hypma_005421 [Hypsizygus marmoreus]